MTHRTCPRCDRRFGARNRTHVCEPATTIDRSFDSRPIGDRAIFDAVATVVDELDDVGEIEIEAVGVGVLFRARRTFVELRPRLVGIGLSVFLPRELPSDRVVRRMRSSGGVANVIVLAQPADVDDEVRGWIAESVEFCR